MIFFVIILAIFLRIYGFPGNFFFEGELGKELLYLRQYSLINKLPLVGMTTSHSWLYYGPFYYWIMMPVFKIFNGNPFILFWSALSFFGIGLTVNYAVVRKIVNEKTALYSSLIQAISPLLIAQTKLSKLHTLFFILSPLLMFALYKVWNGEKKWIFWAGIVYGLMFSFHFSQIPLVVVFILLFWIKRRIYAVGDWLKFATGIFLPNITYFFQDLKIFIWLPYRTLNIADKNPAGTLQIFWEYLGSNLFFNRNFWTFGVLIFVAVFTYYILSVRKKFTEEFLPFYLISTIGVMLTSNVLHGAFPIHYFLPIFTIVPILYSVYLTKFRWGILILVLIFLINFRDYFNFQKPVSFVPFEKQLVVSKFIADDSKGKTFSIKRTGPFDYFPEQYSQNYKYLSLWQGGNLVENSGNIYTITENGENVEVQK